MAKPENLNNYGPPWSYLLERYLDGKGEKTFNSQVFHYENEVKTMRYVHGTPVIRDTANKWLDMLREPNESSEGESNRLRELGNKIFRKQGSARKAATLYTEAIYAAPANSQALSLAHANRAAALHKLGEYEAAYNDCECAIHLNYPKTDMILLRQATCARSLNDASKLDACVTKLESLELGDKFPVVKEFRKDLATIPDRNDHAALPSVDQPVEKKQTILRSPDRGRYVVAGESIARNEQIMTEDALAFVPVFEDEEEEECNEFDCFCHNCAENDIVPFSCHTCRRVSYCSPRCRNEHAPIHSVECDGYMKSIFRQIGIAHLALRAFLVEFENVLDNLVTTRKGQEKYMKAEDVWSGILQTAKDGNLIGLCTNFHILNNSVDLIRYALTASMLCCYLVKRSDYFKRTEKKRHVLMTSDIEWEMVGAALLLRLTSQMICNAHSITGHKIKSPFSGSTYPAGQLSNTMHFMTLFAGIYPRVSLYNHSCEPSFRNEYRLTKLVIVSEKDIAEGAEIFNCYDKHYKKYKRQDRITALQEQYGFTCDCEHCRSGSDENFENFHKVICKTSHCQAEYVAMPESGSTCPQCHRAFDDNICVKLLQKAGILDESVEKYNYLYDKYNRGRRYFTAQNPWRSIHATVILHSFLISEDRSVQSSAELNGKMIAIAIDLLRLDDNVEFHIFRQSFVQGSVFLLDLLSLRRERHFDEIPIDCDLNIIRRAHSKIFFGKIKEKCEKFWRRYIDV